MKWHVVVYKGHYIYASRSERKVNSLANRLAGVLGITVTEYGLLRIIIMKRDPTVWQS